MNGITMKAGMMCGRLLTATEALKLIWDGRTNGNRAKVKDVRRILEQTPAEVCVKFIPNFAVE